MKTKKPILFNFTLFLCFFALNPQISKAYSLFPGKFPAHKATNLKYYIDSSATSDWGYTTDGLINWSKSPTIIKVTGKVQRESISQLRFYYTGSDRGRTVASALNCDGSRCGNNTVTTYEYSRIQYHLGFLSLSPSNKKETAAHEIGHALGLDHENQKKSIMKSAGYIGTAEPQVDDWNGIITKYR